MSDADFFSGHGARLFGGHIVDVAGRRAPAVSALGMSVLAHFLALLIVVMMFGRVNAGTDLTRVATDLSSRIAWIPDGAGVIGGGSDGAPTPLQPHMRTAGEFRTRSTHPDTQATSQSPTAMYEVPVASAIAQLEVLPGIVSPLTIAGSADDVTAGGGDRAGGGKNGDGGGDAVGPGTGRGDDRYHVGNSVTSPRLIKEVKPGYTSEAMRARIQGTVMVRVVVLPDGSVTGARIVRSLDPAFGLDRAALSAVNLWRFKPGTLGGRAVPATVDIELTFTLR
jgi:periplasmic protein TonB